MGDNQSRLAKEYLRIQKKRDEALTAGKLDSAELMYQRLQGMKFAYETYVNHVNDYYGSIEYLVKKYEELNGGDC